MLKTVLKYFIIFLIISINFENFKDRSNSENLIVLVFVIVFILIIINLFKTSKNKNTTGNNKSFQIHPKAEFDKKSLTQSRFQKNINSQLNSNLKRQIEIFWAGDEHRTHPWSIEPGGSTVVVLFKDQKCIGYDKVKRPDKYTIKISSDYISNNYSNVKLDSLEEYIEGIYLVLEGNIALKKVWDSNINATPWGILEGYRTK